MALQLRRRGVARVRPLAGGLAAWRERGYPLARIPAQPAVSAPEPDGAPPARPVAG